MAVSKDWPYIRRQPVTRDVTVREMWFAVARIREKNGDRTGAARARRNARAQPNQKFKKKFEDCKAQCIVYKECGCPVLCAERARENSQYCVRQDSNPGAYATHILEQEK